MDGKEFSFPLKEFDFVWEYVFFEQLLRLCGI